MSYTDLLAGFKRIRPEIHLKCFTAVEIAFFSDLYAMSDEQVLRALMDAGLDSLPGGGAEVFSERVRRKICHDKADADRWLSIHRLAHRLGMRSNVTMLYGHIETLEERVDHMLRARALQDETGGFQAFIPLAFHPDNNQMRKLPAPSANDTLRVHAVARLMLDNIPHVKAFWIATGVGVAQTALWFGVDDLDGTVQEEKIYHMAGTEAPESMTTAELQRLIRAAGREPVERDTLYNVVAAAPADVTITKAEVHEGAKSRACGPGTGARTSTRHVALGTARAPCTGPPARICYTPIQSAPAGDSRNGSWPFLSLQIVQCFTICGVWFRPTARGPWSRRWPPICRC